VKPHRHFGTLMVHHAKYQVWTSRRYAGRYLYITDSCNVNRINFSGSDSQTKWSVNAEPSGISVTPQSTVLVACTSVHKLKEYTSAGKPLHKIFLQDRIANPWLAIRLSDGRYLVSHGSSTNGAALQVSIIDTHGHVAHSYGCELPSSPASNGRRMNVRCPLVVDKDGFVLAVDCVNSRLLLLTPALAFVRHVELEKHLDNRKATAMYLDADRRRLYVARNEWKDVKTATGHAVVVSF